MPENPSSRIRVAVLARDAEETRKAREELSKHSADSEVRLYDGVLTGWTTPEGIEAMRHAKLCVRRNDAAPVTAEVRQHALESMLPPDARGLESISPGSGTGGVVRCVLRLRGPMRPEWRAALHSSGVSLLERTGPDRWLVLAQPAALRALAAYDWVLDFVKHDTSPVSAVSGAASTSAESHPGEPLATAPRATASGVGAGSPGGLESMGASRVLCFDVLAYDASALDRVRQILREAGLSVRQEARMSLRFEAPASSPVPQRLREIPDLRSVEEYRPPRLCCEGGLATIGLTRVNKAKPPAQWIWSGAGEVIGILDSGVDGAHPDLQGAITQQIHVNGSQPQDTIGHGTHVCGIALGRGLRSVTGAAPAATGIVKSMVDANGSLILPLEYRDLFQEMVDAGARILNLSWGWPIGGDYDQGSSQVDEFARSHPDVLLVIAAGNEGKAPQGTHLRRTIGAPASAKNAITVGACTLLCPRQNAAGAAANCANCNLNWGQFRGTKFPAPPAAKEPVCGPALAAAGLSSRGPTEFRSIKPDLLAPGVLVESARSRFAPSPQPIFEAGCPLRDEQHSVCMSGTSMAAPFVSGAAALVRQWLRQGLSLAAPSAALLKACLIAATARLAAVQTGEPNAPGFPDYDQGFGVLDLSRLFGDGAAKPTAIVVDAPNDSVHGVASRVQPGSTVRSFKLFRFQVPPGAAGPLRISLAWTDLPGKHLQNNLQLDLQLPDGSTRIGNEELRFGRDEFDEAAGDQSNNVELIELSNPPAGKYRVTVFAQSTLFPNPPGADPRTTTQGAQGFALVVLGPVQPEADMPGAPPMHTA